MTVAAVGEGLSGTRRTRFRPPGFLSTTAGRIGVALLVPAVLVASFGSLIAPQSIAAPIGLPGSGSTSSALLGTDYLGRDVLSRTLAGGRSVLLLSVLSTVLTYVVATAVGLIAGFKRRVDPWLMRAVDVMLSVPALLLLLVLVAGGGQGDAVLILGVALVLFPGAARIIRTATLEASVRGYVEAALARGERTRDILLREIFPNIIQVVLADLGIRFSAAIVLIASLNFLGVGIQPPSADWGLMIAENRVVLTTSVWAVLAPAVMLGLLTVGVNLTADAYARTLGQSRGGR